jgi:hypothetical protein
MEPDVVARLENLEARLARAVARAEALADELSGLVGHVKADQQEEPKGPMVRLHEGCD